MTWSPVQTAASSSKIGDLAPLAQADGTLALTFKYQNEAGSGGVGEGRGIVYSNDDGHTWSAQKDIANGVGSEVMVLLVERENFAEVENVGGERHRAVLYEQDTGNIDFKTKTNF